MPPTAWWWPAPPPPPAWARPGPTKQPWAARRTSWFAATPPRGLWTGAATSAAPGPRAGTRCPCTPLNAVQSSYGGGAHDAFVTAFNAGGASLAWSTYLGGMMDDSAAGLALDLDNNAYVIGSTASSNFPTASPFQASTGGGTDA